MADFTQTVLKKPAHIELCIFILTFNAKCMSVMYTFSQFFIDSFANNNFSIIFRFHIDFQHANVDFPAKFTIEHTMTGAIMILFFITPSNFGRWIRTAGFARQNSFLTGFRLFGVCSDFDKGRLEQHLNGHIVDQVLSCCSIAGMT